MKEEKKYKLKKYGKIIIPMLVIGIIIAIQIFKIQWNGTPSTIEVSSEEIQQELKEALGQDKMLTIAGKTDRITYEWFYDVGTIQSIYDTNLTIYETGQWEQKVSDCLKASSVFAYQYSKDIQLNGLPVLTIKLLHQNTEDVILYQLNNGVLTFVSNPIVNLMEDGAEITFPVYDTEGIICLVSDSQNKVAVASLDGEESNLDELLAANERKNDSYADYGTYVGQEGSLAGETNASDNLSDSSGDLGEQSNESGNLNSGKNISQSSDSHQNSNINGSQSNDSRQSSNINGSQGDDLTNKNDSLSMEELVQNANGDSLAKVDVPSQNIGNGNESNQTSSNATDKTGTSSHATNQTGTSSNKTSTISEDKKPSGQANSISNSTSSNSSSSENRVVSDGKQTQKDEYETDPVPAGKPLPVEPENQVINYKKSYSCTLSIDCLTIQDNLKDLDSTKKAYVPEDGYIFKSKKVIFYEGESVFDVLLRETQKAGIQMEYSMTPIYNSNYIEGIHNLYEFDCGNLSGWMYSVDGWYPNYGCSRYILCDGEVIKWRYTCDLGRDVGCEWLDESK